MFGKRLALSHLANAGLLALQVRLVVARDEMDLLVPGVHSAAITQVDENQMPAHHEQGENCRARIIRILAAAHEKQRG